MRIDFLSKFKVIIFLGGTHLILFLCPRTGPIFVYLVETATLWRIEKKRGCCVCCFTAYSLGPWTNCCPASFWSPVDPFSPILPPTHEFWKKNSVLHKSSTLVKAWRCINKREAERCLYKKEASSSGSLSIVGASLVRNQHGKDELNVGFAPSCPLRSCRFVLLPRHEIHRLAITRLEI